MIIYRRSGIIRRLRCRICMSECFFFSRPLFFCFVFVSLLFLFLFLSVFGIRGYRCDADVVGVVQGGPTGSISAGDPA